MSPAKNNADTHSASSAGMEFDSPDRIAIASSTGSEEAALAFACDLLDTSDAIIYVFDEETHELYFANRRALERWGKSDYEGRICYEFVRGRSDPCPWCTGSKMAGSSYHEEKYDEESNYYLDITCKRILWRGRPAIASITVDAAQRNLDDFSMERDRDALKTIIDSIPTGVLVYRAEGGNAHLVTSNLAARALAGVTKEELVAPGQDALISRVHPEDRSLISATFSKLVSSPTVASEAFRLFDQGKGGYKWLSLDSHSVHGKGDAMVVFTCITDITAVKETEHSLDNERKAYAAAIDAGGFSVWEYDIRNRRITMATDTFGSEKFAHAGLGKVVDDVPGAFVPLIDEKSVPVFLDMYARIDEGEPNPSCEIWCKATPNREPACLKISYTVTCDDFGKPALAYGIAQNITAQKHMEERYRREVAFLRDIDRSDLIAKGHHDLTANLLLDYSTASKQALDVSVGTEYDEAFEAMVKLPVEKEDRKRLADMLYRQNLIRRFEEGSIDSSMEYLRKVGDMPPTWVSTAVKTFRSPETGHIECFIYTYDVTERALERQIISQLVNQRYDFLCLLDVKASTYRRYNWDFRKSAEPSAPIDYEEGLVRRGEEGIPQEAKQRGKDALSLGAVLAALETDDTYSYSFDMWEDGSMRRKRMDYSYLDDSHSTILFSRSDITKQYEADRERLESIKRAMENADRANKAKSVFLSSISHDMRTPLNGIIGFTDLALGEDGDDSRREYLEKIKSASTVLLGLINDTLDLSRIESNALILQPEICDARTTLVDVMTSVQASATAKGIDFIVDYSKARQGFIRIDRVNNQKIFLNLLSNAVKFTPPGGTVKFAVEDLDVPIDGCNARMTVSDNGIGIAKELLPMIFEPFVQEHDESAGASTGTGLGLSIVKRLVGLMGGRIDVQSTKGVGTTFTVMLPMEWVDDEIARAKASQKEEESDVDLSGKHILLCEDNAMNTEIACEMLRRRGMEVACAADGAEGARMFAESAPGEYDAVLMDIRMPRANGYEAARMIRNLDRPDAHTVPIVAMTADAYLEDIQHCLDAGMDGHISKPIDPARLFSLLGRLCV